MKADASQNRDYWPFYQLEQYIQYKAQLRGVPVEKVPAAYTSKSCFKCGRLGERNRHQFRCQCGYQGHSDHNASRNIGAWVGLSCSLELQVLGSGVHDTPLSSVIGTQLWQDSVPQLGAPERTRISAHTALAVGVRMSIRKSYSLKSHFGKPSISWHFLPPIFSLEFEELSVLVVITY